MPVARRVRSCTFRYKNLEEAKNSPILPRAHRHVDFEGTVFTPPPVLGITVVGKCQGWRRVMEDRSCVLKTAENGVLAVVLDGHRGEQAAVFCANTLPQAILNNIKRGVQNEEVNDVNRMNASSGGVDGVGVVVIDGNNNNNNSTSNVFNNSEETTHALEIFSGDPNCDTRRDAFVRAFVETDTQLFDFQGGSNLYYTEPRNLSSVIPSRREFSSTVPSRRELSSAAPSRRELSSTVVSKADSSTQRTVGTKKDDDDDDDDDENEELSGTYGVLDSLGILETPLLNESSDALNNYDDYSFQNTNSSLDVEDRWKDTVSSMASTTRRPPPSSGATAIAVHVDAKYITISNLGDCRAFIIERRADNNITSLPADMLSSSLTLLGDDAARLTSSSSLSSSPAAGMLVRNAAVAHRPTQNRRESTRLERQFGPRVVVNGRVLGTLMVTRSFGDFDVKFGMTTNAGAAPPEGFALPPTAVQNPNRRSHPQQNLTSPVVNSPYRYQYHDDVNNKLGKEDGFDEEEWESPLLVSNVPHTRVWRRAQLPRPPPGGWNSTDIIPYDLIMAGSDGTWELNSATHLANRADAALQPLLQEWYQHLNNNDNDNNNNNNNDHEEKEKEFMAVVEKTLKDVVTETLQGGIARVCSQHGGVPGGDNMSLAVVLLL
ncbi:putative protein phosphatase 2C [Trypanosoma theileri]|uniref:PPM-type phosphatase domain-containing protein n=1 Tax=Trypanosoma theileri TaxID=67003 RepID=A0A1X0NTX9_9TRYP|nr:putative protein phosphatase 2C [Trypanosoma theileri]ORC88164.1 putative protein phosphatase 2C [Trypanosoma theileri]